MTYANTGAMLLRAHHQRYCVGAFNIVDFTTLEGAVRAAETVRSPIIVQASSGTVKRYGASTLVGMTHLVADRMQVPVALHLDHCFDRSLIHDCIVAGFSSVMVDASHYPLEENIRFTRDVVDEARRSGVSVEGEIGVIAGVEDDLVITQDAAIYTTPSEALAFQARSGVDFLAVAIGTAHGVYKTAPRLDLPALTAIRAQAHFPLVVHGGTGLSTEVVQSLVSSGCSKMNFSTQLKITFIDSLYGYIDGHRQEYNPLRVLDHARDCVSTMVGHYLEILGCAGKCADTEETDEQEPA